MIVNLNMTREISENVDMIKAYALIVGEMEDGGREWVNYMRRQPNY